jgi:hypothetical protein
MNAPLPTPSSEKALRRVVLETNRVAAPTVADRERITEALRTRLGADILPEGFVPAAGGASGSNAGTTPTQSASGVAPSAPRSLGKRGWLNTVVGTGVVAGALGFVLGHGVGQREQPAPLQPVAAIEAPEVVAVEARATPAHPLPQLEPPPVPLAKTAALTSGEPASDGSRASRAADSSAPVERAPAQHRVSSRVARRGASPASAAPPLSFAEVLERVQRANAALREGRAPLALIVLEELERGGGEMLREERDATRALALCAIGDVAGARRVAAALVSRATSSIYAPRLAASCAAPESQ